MTDEYTHKYWSAYTHAELTDKSHYEMSGNSDVIVSMALKPFKVASVIVNPEVVTTGASVMISIVIEENTHEQWAEYTNSQLSKYTHDELSGMYHWEDWDSSTWSEVSTLIWGA